VKTFLKLVVLFGMSVSAAGPVAAQPAPALEGRGISEFSDDLREVSRLVAPAVVQIFVTGYGSPVGTGTTTESLIPRKRGSGSGVILDPSGYIVTNFHVVENAERIHVQVSADVDGRERNSILKGNGGRYGAQVVGVDAETDLAVLKIAATDLPYLELADSEELGLGEVVLAFGSPLGLENSVTMGVVSSVARQLRPEDPMIYIQTDAPINPGNSGGPLVNARGEVVGINTLIMSQGGGSEGIGFAAPSNIVRAVFTQLRKSGRVRRGEVGIYAQTITPEMARGLGLTQGWGVIAGDVVPGGPAAMSGVEPGDLILALDGKTMENGRQFGVNVYRHEVGDVVTLTLLHGSQRLEKRVPVIERRDDPQRFSQYVTRDKNLIPALGILAVETSGGVKALLPPLRFPDGVLVAARAADAPPGIDPLQPGDVIYAVNGVRIKTLAALRAKTEAFTSGEVMVLQVEREGSLRFLALVLD